MNFEWKWLPVDKKKFNYIKIHFNKKKNCGIKYFSMTEKYLFFYVVWKKPRNLKEWLPNRIVSVKLHTGLNHIGPRLSNFVFYVNFFYVLVV